MTDRTAPPPRARAPLGRRFARALQPFGDGRDAPFWPFTLRGTAAVVLGAAALITAHQVGLVELVYVAVLLWAATALGWVSLWFVHRYGDVARSFSPDVAAVGQPTDVTLHATARGGFAGAAARWQDGLGPGWEGEASGMLPPAAAAEHVRLHYRARPTVRGVREVGPFRVIVTDPFGFARRRIRLGTVESVTVAPATVALPPLTEFPGEAGGSLHTATHQLGEGADNLIPRVYMPGDSMRRINWRASAHHDELMVRQEEQESTPEATVVLDRAETRWSAAAHVPGADPAFETAVTLVLSAAARLIREGYDVSVIEADGRPIGAPVPAGDGVALEQLAVDLATVSVAGEDRLTLLPRLFAATMAGPLVIVTGRLTVADAERLAPVVGHTALPMLFATDPDRGAVERARAAGWRAAALVPDADVAETWRGAADRGRAHASA